MTRTAKHKLAEGEAYSQFGGVPATLVDDDDEYPLHIRDAMDHVADDEVCDSVSTWRCWMVLCLRRREEKVLWQVPAPLCPLIGVGTVSRGGQWHQSFTHGFCSRLGKEFRTYKVDKDKRLSRLEEATLSEARVLDLARSASPVRAPQGVLGNQTAPASSRQQKQSDDLGCLAVASQLASEQSACSYGSSSRKPTQRVELYTEYFKLTPAQKARAASLARAVALQI
eukprot:2265170-Amphidinium_carterae.3